MVYASEIEIDCRILVNIDWEHEPRDGVLEKMNKEL